MEYLADELFRLAERLYQPELDASPHYQAYCRVLALNLNAVKAAMGQEDRNKLSDSVEEYTQLLAQAALVWGLRLGLSLPRL